MMNMLSKSQGEHLRPALVAGRSLIDVTYELFINALLSLTILSRPASAGSRRASRC